MDLHISSSDKQHAIPAQNPEDAKRLRLPDFKAVGTLRW